MNFRHIYFRHLNIKKASYVLNFYQYEHVSSKEYSPTPPEGKVTPLAKGEINISIS